MLKAPYPWQQKIWADLMAMKKTDKLPHALLFHGKRGLGKGDFASSFARTLLCQKQAGGNLACGTCPSCKLSGANVNPDLMTLNPLEKNKQIKVDQVRLLTEKLSLTSHDGGVRAVVINPLDKLTKGAFNALLKSLEEPKANIIFLLVTSEMSQIPLTIKSRASKMSFSSATNTEVIDYLNAHKEDEALQELNIQKLSYWLDGAPCLFDEVGLETYQIRDEINQTLLSIYTNKAPLDEVKLYDKKPLAPIIAALMSFVSDLTKVAFNCPKAALSNPDYTEDMEKMASHLEHNQLFKFYDRLIESKRQLLSGMTGINQTMLIESLFINWSRLTKA